MTEEVQGNRRAVGGWTIPQGLVGHQELAGALCIWKIRHLSGSVSSVSLGNAGSAWLSPQREGRKVKQWEQTFRESEPSAPETSSPLPNLPQLCLSWLNSTR